MKQEFRPAAGRIRQLFIQFLAGSALVVFENPDQRFGDPEVIGILIIDKG